MSAILKVHPDGLIGMILEQVPWSKHKPVREAIDAIIVMAYDRGKQHGAAAIAEAIAEERKACAKVAETIPWSAATAEGEWALREAAKVIANQIRSR